MEFKVVLRDLNEVREFVKAAEACEGPVDVKSGTFYIDAKSFLGIVGLGLKKELKVICHNQDSNFPELVGKFLVA